MLITCESEVAQLCPTLCHPVDYSSPGSSVHGILQARILEWVAISFSRGSSQPRDQTRVSCIAGRRFSLWATREAMADEAKSNYASTFSLYLEQVYIISTQVHWPSSALGQESIYLTAEVLSFRVGESKWIFAEKNTVYYSLLLWS